MDKRFVVVAAILMYGITAYFSYGFFSPIIAKSGQANTSLPVADTVIEAETDSGEFTGKKDQECPLNGEMLTAQHRSNWEKRRPLGVMIENSTSARPQSGLTSADVIFEFVAEGGITRFLSVFYCKDAKFVGPVRSARMYFINELQGFGNYPLYAHVGGANTPGPANALGEIEKLGWANYNDLNQFSIPYPTYWRDYSRLKDVDTEHTMYSSTSKLWGFAAEKRRLTDVNDDKEKWDDGFTAWTFADDESNKGTTTAISYDFWAGKASYSVSWTYDATTNSYIRSHGDRVAHTDLNNKQSISSKNLVVMFVKESKARDGYEGGHLLYGTQGKGDALVFQNGDVTKATWKKTKETDLVRFYDTSGEEISMIRGQIWISGVPTGNTVTY